MQGRTITWVAVACLAAACRTSPSNPVETRISVLHVNMRSIVDVPDGDAQGFWTTRYNRIGADLKALGETPDVIALQEMPTRVWCPTNFNFILDYEPLRAVLVSLQNGLGVRYRIAYMQVFTRDHRMGSGPTSNGGTVADCRAASGLALLYNPDRIRNLATDTDAATQAAAYAFDQNTNSPQLRRSMPCCAGKVRPGHEGVCALIDGPPQNDSCGFPSPAGLAMQVSGTIAVARLELALRTNTTFHIYNLHIPWRGSPGYQDSLDNLREIVDAVEGGAQRWIPPLIVGDFNNEPEFLEEPMSDFTSFGAADLDGIIYTLGGTASKYTSRATIARHTTTRLPVAATTNSCKNDVGILWSDHCAVLTTLFISEN